MKCLINTLALPRLGGLGREFISLGERSSLLHAVSLTLERPNAAQVPACSKMEWQLTPCDAPEFSAPGPRNPHCFLRPVAVGNSCLLNHSFGPMYSVEKDSSEMEMGLASRDWPCESSRGGSELGFAPGELCSALLPLGSAPASPVICGELSHMAFVLAAPSTHFSPILVHELPSLQCLPLSLAFPKPAPPHFHQHLSPPAPGGPAYPWVTCCPPSLFCEAERESGHISQC